MANPEIQLQWFLRRKNIILFCLGLFICISAITLTACLDRHLNTKEHLLREDQITANLLSIIIEERLLQIVKTMELYANRPSLVQAARKKDVTSAMKNLVSLTTSSPGINNVIITDKEATVWAAYPLRPELIGKNMSDQEWYKEVSKDWKPHITDAVVRIVAEKDLAVQVVVPILDERGEVISLLVDTYRLIALGQFIQWLPTDPECFNNVVDRKGNLIYSNRFSYDKELTPCPFFADMLQIQNPKDQSVPVAAPFLNSRPHYISHAPLELIGWSIFIGRDSRAILRSESGFYIQTATIGLLLFLTITLALVYIRKKEVLKQYEFQIRAERELSRSEERFRATFEQAAVGMARVGPDGRWLEVNQRLCDIVGYTRDELSALTFQDITHPEDLSTDLDYVRQVLAGQIDSYYLEKRYICKDESIVWINLTVRLVRDSEGEPAYFISVVENINERKLAEEALMASEERYRILFNAMDEGFCIIEMIFNVEGRPVDFRFLEVNLAFEKQTGLSEATGKSMRELAPAHEEQWFEIFGNIALTGEPLHFMNEASALNRWFDVYAYRVGRPEDRQVAIVFSDITGRKQAEEKIIQVMADLQSSNKELEQFAYVASHDLQEPLRMVSSYTQLLAERYRDKLDDKANLFIHYAVDGAVRMQLLINDLLTYSRIGSRGKALELVDSHAALGEAISNLKMNIDEARAIITNDQLPEVVADATQLAQLFQNLISNALKFRSEANPLIHIAAQDEGAEWLFSVRDNGIGIDPQFADKIFVIFQRLHTKEEYPGSGIGLAICKKIVERHGGRIWFESRPGSGATFYFTISK